MRLDRYLFRQLILTLVLVAVSLACVVWLSQSLRYVEMMVNRGLSAWMFLYFTTLLLPTMVAIVLPIALFTAILFVYNKLTIDSELVVMRALGISHVALARPALVLAVITTAATFALTTWLVPASYRAFKDLQFTIKSSYSGVLIQEGVFNTLLDGITVYVRGRTAEGELQGIIIHDGRTTAKPITMMAERGALVSGPTGPRVVMFNGNRHEVEPDGRLSLLHFERYTFDIGVMSGSGQRGGGRNAAELYIRELLDPPPGSSESTVRRWHAEAHYRLATPLLCLSLGLVALAFLLSGDYNRRGQTIRIAGAVVAAVAIEAAFIGVRNQANVEPALVWGMYVVAILPVAAGLYVLAGFRRPRRVAATAGAG